MWEGEPVGVDQKRPLVGFALVAVLCAILMTVSVGRGWADIFEPGRPIAAAALGGPADRAQAPTPQPGALHDDDAAITIPVELSAQPLGVAVGSLVSRTSGATSGVESRTAESPTTLQTTLRVSMADRQADKAAVKAARKADKAARKADKAAAKAARKAQKAAAKAERKARKAAEKAARKG